MKKQAQRLAARMLVVTIVVTMLAGTAPAMASAIKGLDRTPAQAKFASSLTPMAPVPVVKLGRVLIEEPEPTQMNLIANVSGPAEEVVVAAAPAVNDTEGSEALEEPVSRAAAAVPVPVTAPDKARTTDSATSPTVRTAPVASGNELAQAQAILAGLVAKYPILAGSTVSIGTTPGGYQAVAYYQSGRIVISSTHTVSLSTILNHEVWHIIDWRDNGQIDWGENIPPR